MPAMVKCQKCGFEFPSRGISFQNKQSFETSTVSNSAIEERCTQCDGITVVSDKSGYFWKD